MKPVIGQAAIASLETAFTRLVELETPRLRGLARRLVSNTDEAADVVQSALADAWAQRAQLASPQSAPAWLRRIVVHRALSSMRRRRMWNTIGALLRLEPETRAEGPDASLDQSRHLARLARALDRLPAQQAAAFTLRYLEGLDFDAVADALGCARGTARIHVQRAVGRLKEEGALEELP